MSEQHAALLENEARKIAQKNPTQAQALLLEAAEVYLNLALATGKEDYMAKAQKLYYEAESVGKKQVVFSDEQSTLAFDNIIAKKPSVTFRDIAGLDSLKQKIMLKIIEPFRNPDVYAYFGKKVGGAILMYGPPGCGKSLIAEATAGEAQATFFSVKASDLKSKFVGETEKNIAALFLEARKRAPSIIFFDEVEALGEKRSDATSVNKGMISQLLTELDGVGNKSQQILVLAATNEPWSIDLALRRDGRFGTAIFVPQPDLASRKHMLGLHLREVPLDSGVDINKISMLTLNYSGADIKGLVDIAVENAIEESLTSKKVRKVHMNDFVRVLKKKKPTTPAWYRQAIKKVQQSGEQEMFSDLVEEAQKVLTSAA